MSRTIGRIVTLECMHMKIDFYFDNAEEAFDWMQKTDSAGSEGPNPHFTLSITDDEEVDA